MLADDRPPTTASPARHDYDGDVTPFDRLGRFVVRRARLVIGAWAVLIAVALPLAPQAPGALSAGGFISDDLESARAKSILEAELGTPPSALVVVFSSPELEAGTPPFELAAAAAMRDIPNAEHVAGVVSHLLQPRQVSADRHTAYDIVLLDLPPDDSPKALPILRSTLREAPNLDRRAGRRSGLLRRCPDSQRAGPPAQRAHLAAPGRARAPARLRVAGGGRRPARRRRRERPGGAGRRLPDRVGDADEHLRAQPRHPPGPGPRRGLLPAHDQPLPRGAGQASLGDRSGRRRRRPADRGDRRPGRVLQRVDRPAGAAGPRALRFHDPAQRRDRRCARRRAGGRRRPHPAAGRAHGDRPASRPVRGASRLDVVRR